MRDVGVEDVHRNSLDKMRVPRDGASEAMRAFAAFLEATHPRVYARGQNEQRTGASCFVVVRAEVTCAYSRRSVRSHDGITLRANLPAAGRGCRTIGDRRV